MPVKSSLESYGGRRWLTSIGILAVSTILVSTDTINPDIWKEIVIYVYGIFAGANVLQRGVEATKEIKTGTKQSTE